MFRAGKTGFRTALGAAAVLGFTMAAPVPAWAGASAPVQVTREQVMLMPVPVHQQLQVVEVLDVTNSGAAAADVVLHLPKDAGSVTVNHAAVAPDADGTLDLAMAAAAKQTATISVAYTVPFVKQTAQIDLHVDDPVDVAELYLPTGQYALAAEDLFTTTRTAQMNGAEVRVYTRMGIPAGAVWPVTIEPIPAAPSTTSDAAKGGAGELTTSAASTLPVIGKPLTERQNLLQATGNLLWAALILGFVVAGVRWFPGSRRRSSAEVALVRALERLEYQRRDGHVTGHVYSQRKAEILAKLERVQQLRDDKRRRWRGGGAIVSNTERQPPFSS
ncbi:hypothetical protein [Alicyclobacillus contaminans]|uniref:hypothetical protein n=1 Tax=Alicyclobacillus contaminans TaxID=392016 RepID=UPI0003F8CBFA|nr:hypothetical protein [Alicyclobacillus contaminans]